MLDIQKRLRALLQRKFVRDTLILQVGKVGTTALTFLSALLVARLLGTTSYGVWALVQSFLTIALTFNLTGLSSSTAVRLPMAVGAKNESEILNLLAVYLKVSSWWAVGLSAVLFFIGPLLASRVYGGHTHIGSLAAVLSLTVLPDALYNLIVTTLQSQRSMRQLAILQNINYAVLFLCTLLALLVSRTAESMVVSRLIYSVITFTIALVFYQHGRATYAVPYPALRAIVSHARHISPRPYLGFGFLNALDKNIANLYTEIPLQMVGALIGQTAAGYLELGFKALTIPTTFASAFFDNLQAVIPQAVGRHDFAGLRKNLLRVLAALLAGAAIFYTAFALVVPWLVALLFDQHWLPAVPVVTALAVYGAVIMVGGVFGPLYRALDLMRPAIVIKIMTLILVLVPGWLLLQPVVDLAHAWRVNMAVTPVILTTLRAGALIGAWMVNGLMLISVVLTALVTLPALRRRAHGDTR
ncbi:MAG: oligosaccharide flippase family protein [Anaerolineae bacterium]